MCAGTNNEKECRKAETPSIYVEKLYKLDYAIGCYSSNVPPSQIMSAVCNVLPTPTTYKQLTSKQLCAKSSFSNNEDEKTKFVTSLSGDIIISTTSVVGYLYKIISMLTKYKK